MLIRLLLCSLVMISGVALAQDAALQQILNQNVAPDDPALVLLVDADGDIRTAARGLADMAAGIPTTSNDRFRIGSITKPFLAVVMLQLAEEGVLSLDEPARDWLPADVVDYVANADTATLRQLMNMTSGIYDYLENDDFWDAVDSNPTYIWKASEALSYAYGEEPYFAPGEDFEYSNSNYILLQLVIERATNGTLAQALRTRIFGPLGMADTYVEIFEDLPGGFIHSYDDVDYDGRLEDVTFRNEGNGLGDGGIISTAADLALFMRGLTEGRLLQPESLDAMLDGVPDGDGSYYGLGMGIFETVWGTAWGHDGLTAGFLSSLIYLPDENLIIVALTNSPLMEDALYTVIEESLSSVMSLSE